MKLLFTLPFCFMLIGLKGQDIMPLGKAVYIQNNSLETSISYNGKTTLLFNRTRSIFILHAAQGPDSSFSSPNYYLPVRVPVDPEGFPIYKILDQKIAITKTNCKESKRHCLVKDTLFPILWSLQPETQQFGNLECHKATCTYWGRNYEAWYAPEIPINNGPYRFGGLPGLIIEIKSTDGKVHYILESLELPYRGDERILPPEGKALDETYISFKRNLLQFAMNLAKDARAKGYDISVTLEEMIEILDAN